MPNVSERARLVREKLYPSQRKKKPIKVNLDISKAPPPIQRAIDRRADKYKRIGK